NRSNFSRAIFAAFASEGSEYPKASQPRRAGSGDPRLMPKAMRWSESRSRAATSSARWSGFSYRMSGLWRWRERLCRLQVSADLVRAARVGVGLRGVVPELGDGVSQRCELGDLLLDLGEARVEEVAHVLAGSSAAVADFEDLADLGEGEARGLAAVDEVDPGGRLGRVVAVS